MIITVAHQKGGTGKSTEPGRRIEDEPAGS